jgi:hypothetical protein
MATRKTIPTTVTMTLVFCTPFSNLLVVGEHHHICRPGQGTLPMVYVFTTFLSAFLLFMVQPLMGKLILPWFGGTPAVWTACMLFYQVTLLGGYAYAHLLTARLRPRQQARLHVSLLALALALMTVALVRWGSPLLPDHDWKPADVVVPVPHILTLLLVSIGLPYLLLSATSPLLQRWFLLLGHGEKTYRLYAVSNAGSLLGLVSYPVLTERFLALPMQAVVWSIAFAVFTAGCLVIVLQLHRRPTVRPSPPAADTRGAAVRPAFLTVLMWLLLTMSTSALLLAVTNELCQEVAAVPFLWILPLALYLLTFIICFDRPQCYRRRGFVAITVVLTLLVLVTSSLGIALKIPVHVLAFGLFLFFFCMTCHGELVGLKPDPRHLTLFYLVIALGGALGGVFVSLLAPVLFNHYWEFNVMATVAWVVLAIIFLRDKQSLFHRGDWWHVVLFAWFLLYTGYRTVCVFGNLTVASSWRDALVVPALLTLPVALLIVWPWRRSRLAGHWFWPRLVVGLVIFLAECFMVARVRHAGRDVIAADRNFYGTLRVRVFPPIGDKIPPSVQLTHGRINHGMQFRDDELRYQPVTYYGGESGIHTAVMQHPRRQASPGHAREPLHIGVLGLGTGTMAAFAQPGDTVRFYEINPTVIAYSTREKPFFTYLRDCKGTTEIVRGDARLSLERELERGDSQKFDILAMDAFSSDSVPVHLLTREAIDVYRAHLRDEDSIIAINISNRFLNLRDLVATHGDEAVMVPLLAVVSNDFPYRSTSSWMLLTRSMPFLRNPAVQQRCRPWSPKRRIIWTDNHSNLFSIIRK